MHQEIQVKLDVAISVDARHSKAELAKLIRRAVAQFLGRRIKVVHHLSFAEEACIYSNEGSWLTLVEAGKDAPLWYVEQAQGFGWADAEWTENDQPLRFSSRSKARDAIREHVEDSRTAAALGMLAEPYRASDYRAINIWGES